jgi:hypothetical protein
MKMEKRVDELLAQKSNPKKDRKRTGKRFGKKAVFGLLAVFITGTLIVSGGLLTFYGKVETTAQVSQSVLLNGNDYTASPITNSFDITGGCCKCISYTLENQGSEDEEINIDTTYNPNGVGITTTYYKSIYEGETITVDGYSLPAEITVENGDCWVTWTIDMDETAEGFYGGHAAVGLVISYDHTDPAFQIHSNDGTDSNFPWGTWLYSPWGDGWHSGDTNKRVSELDWVQASGKRDLVDNPNLIYTIKISKCKLGETFYWGIALMGSTCDTKYPDTWNKWSGEASGLVTLDLMEEITSPFILPAYFDNEWNIITCYCFDSAIIPGTYIIKTKLTPS